jgi:hypothetical protein
VLILVHFAFASFARTFATFALRSFQRKDRKGSRKGRKALVHLFSKLHQHPLVQSSQDRFEEN